MGEKFYIGNVVESDLMNLMNAGMFSATSDLSFVKDMDFIAICVGLRWMFSNLASVT